MVFRIMGNRLKIGALFGVLLLATALFGQTTLGRISGTVADPSGAVVPNAKVTATNEDTKLIVTTTTSNTGAFSLPQLPVGTYNVRVEAEGLKSASYSKVKIDTGLEYSLTARLEIGATTETIEVVAGADLINTTTAEVSNVVAKEQIRELPLISRNPLSLVTLQAGVPGISDRASTAINGARPGWTQVTQDGINIQDNFIRTNGLDFVPNRPTSDNVGEFSITTNNLGADQAGGSSQVKFATEAGTNKFHGSLYEFNRNNFFSANTWQNNNATTTIAGVRTSTPIKKPFLNRNQFGGRLGGPIVQNKLFFFGYYERFWEVSQVSAARTIPLYDALLSGEFRYNSGTTGTGPLTTVNVLTLAGLTPTAGGLATPVRNIDSAVQTLILSRIPSAANVTSPNGASTLTGIQDFNQSDQVKRHFFGGRIDYSFRENHNLEFTYKRSTDFDYRTDIDAFNPTPNNHTYATTDFYVAAWHWTLNPRMQNELRLGGNLAPVAFITEEKFGTAIFTIPLLSNPTVNFQAQGRDSRTYQYIDNFSWSRGNHQWVLGGSFENVRIQPFVNGFNSTALGNGNGPDLFPQYFFGYSSAAPCSGTTCESLRASNFPAGISSANLTNANSLRALLSGYLQGATQTFEVKDASSGFTPGIANVRDLTLNTLDFYARDNWRVLPNLTLNLGIKWEYWTPLREEHNLALEPQLNGKTLRQAVLDPATTVDFVKGAFYNKDLNNFGPSLGFAWDPWKNGKTSLRGGYTLTFVNDETITTGRNAVVSGNPGLSTNVVVNNLANTFLAAGAPPVPVPAFKIPRTQADQIQLASTSAIFGIDPNIRTPFVHQLNLSLQRELPGDMAIEARYVGTLAHKLWRGVDFNQQTAGSDAVFLAEFARARENLFTCGAVTGAACPNAGSTMPIITGFGFTGNSLITTPILQNSPGTLADVYVSNLLTGPGGLSYKRFLPNPGIYVADGVFSGGNQAYHGLQIELRRRMKNGIFGQINYTWSKTLADTFGTAQARFEPLLDNARPQLERRISDFHVSHIVNANMIYQLPFGKGKRWIADSGPLDYIVGGWQVGSIIHWQTGAPFSILSQRGTFNRGGRSGFMTAVSSLSRHQIQDLFGIFRCGEGGVSCPAGTAPGTMFFVNPSVIGADGRGVGPDNLTNSASTAFNQVFFNPTAGQIGNLGINAFTGPMQFQWDFSTSKKTKLTEKVNLEFRAEFFNVLNHTNWFIPQAGTTAGNQFQNINSTSFARLVPGSVNGSDGSDHRVIQFALKLNF